MSGDLTPYLQPTKHAIDEQCIYEYGFGGSSSNISSYDLGAECDRSAWLKSRIVGKGIKDARLLRYFQSCKDHKKRVIYWLEGCGVEVWDQNKQLSFADFKAKSRIDGMALGVKEAPEKNHLLSIRPLQDKAFKDVIKNGMPNKDKIKINIDMNLLGVDRCLYIAVNKNNDEIHIERIKADKKFAKAQLTRSERIVSMTSPPARIGNGKPSWFQCKICPVREECFK